MRWLALAACLLATTPAAAQIGAQFDLVCTGTFRTGAISRLFSLKQSPATPARYRINLASARWCDQDCKETKPIFNVTAQEIVLKAEQDKGSDGLLTINRESGAWIERFRSYDIDMIMVTTGTCEPAPFSGFPVRKF